MPCFVCSVPINTCVKQLLVLFHGGVLWIGNTILVDVELIAIITGLPFTRMDPMPFLKEDQEPMITVWMMDKYNVVRDNRCFRITSINDYTILFFVKVLALKLFPMMCPNQCSAREIALAELCAKGVHINWSQYMLK